VSRRTRHVCSNGACVAQPDCNTHADCASGMSCTEGNCMPTSCANNNDCFDGSVCLSSKFCDPPAAKCADDTDCPSTQLCSATGTCSGHRPPSRKTNLDCAADGTVCLPNGYCGPAPPLTCDQTLSKGCPCFQLEQGKGASRLTQKLACARSVPRRPRGARQRVRPNLLWARLY